MSANLLIGWFDDANQPVPSSDPPHDGPCLLCGDALTAEDVRTHCLMYPHAYAARSYFYRTHRTCAETAGPLAADDFALKIIDRMESRP